MISCSVDPEKVLCRVFLADTHAKILKSLEKRSLQLWDRRGFCMCISMSRWNCTEILKTLVRGAENTFLQHLQSKNTIKSPLWAIFWKKICWKSRFTASHPIFRISHAFPPRVSWSKHEGARINFDPWSLIQVQEAVQTWTAPEYSGTLCPVRGRFGRFDRTSRLSRNTPRLP